MRGFAIIVGFTFLGHLLHVFYVPLPGNVIGLILLVTALFKGWVKLSWIEESAQFLIKHMLLFFTPIIIGVLVIFNEYKNQLLPIVISVIISTFVVLLVSGWVVQKLSQDKMKKVKKVSNHEAIDA